MPTPPLTVVIRSVDTVTLLVPFTLSERAFPVAAAPAWNALCQTPLHGYRLRTCCTTPPTDELMTILQLAVQQIHYQWTKICHIPTS